MTMTVQLCRVDPGVDPIAKIEEHEEELEKIYVEIFGDEDDAWPTGKALVTAQAEVDVRLKALNQRIGLTDGYLDSVHPLPKTASKLHPEHPFRIDYWFSGPTSKSLNNTLLRQTGDDLTHIFRGWANFYEKPNWEEAADAIRKVSNRLTGAFRGVDVYELSENPFMSSDIHSAGEALEAFFHMETDLTEPRRLTAAIFEKPLEVLAAFHGTATLHPDQPATFLVHEWTEDDLRWYVEALDIVEEQARFAAAHPDRDNLILRWNSVAGLDVYE